MSNAESGYSPNGRASDTWHRSWTHLRVDRRSSGYCRVTFDHPPINAITDTTVAELAEVIGLIEHDTELCVVVFDSANPDFYLAQYDTDHESARTAALEIGTPGVHAWLDSLLRLSRAPVLSIASVRGRACGAGTEFVLACDMRFASRENAAFGQFGVPSGVVSSGSSIGRLARLIGRSRALEVVLVGDDLDGPRAEQYGYVNRAISTDELDAEIDAIAVKLARLHPEAIARAKSSVDRGVGESLQAR